jgi:hypothetical protein
MALSPNCLLIRAKRMGRISKLVWLKGFARYVISADSFISYADHRGYAVYAWTCGNSIAGIAGSNPTGGMYLSLFLLVCEFSGRGLCVGQIGGVLPSVACLSMSAKPR